jgi:hypothetical protein
MRNASEVVILLSCGIQPAEPNTTSSGTFAAALSIAAAVLVDLLSVQELARAASQGPAKKGRPRHSDTMGPGCPARPQAWRARGDERREQDG